VGGGEWEVCRRYRVVSPRRRARREFEKRRSGPRQMGEDRARGMGKGSVRESERERERERERADFPAARVVGERQRRIMHFLVVPSNKSQLNINATGVIVCKLGLRLLGGSSFASLVRINVSPWASLRRRRNMTSR